MMMPTQQAGAATLGVGDSGGCWRVETDDRLGDHRRGIERPGLPARNPAPVDGTGDGAPAGRERGAIAAARRRASDTPVGPAVRIGHRRDRTAGGLLEAVTSLGQRRLERRVGQRRQHGMVEGVEADGHAGVGQRADVSGRERGSGTVRNDSAQAIGDRRILAGARQRVRSAGDPQPASHAGDAMSGDRVVQQHPPVVPQAVHCAAGHEERRLQTEPLQDGQRRVDMRPVVVIEGDRNARPSRMRRAGHRLGGDERHDAAERLQLSRHQVGRNRRDDRRRARRHPVVEQHQVASAPRGGTQARRPERPLPAEPCGGGERPGANCG